MGIHHFVFKPGLSKLDARQFKADLQAFAARLVQDVLPGMEQPRGPQPPERRPAAPRAPVGAPPEPPADEAARQMRGLQALLEELRLHGDPAQISVLVMKVAREYFERAVLFLVKNDELRGLAGFGAAPQGESLNLLSRDVVIPLTEPSVFQRAVVDRKPFTGDWPDGKGGSGLLAKIGRFQARRLALLPLVTHRQTMALLLGDNPETGRDPARLESLEVFLDQAGTALENLLLQRKLQALQP
jgi:GAF domain-containing protein